MNKALQASMEAIDFQRNSTLIKELALQFDTAIKDPSLETLNKVSMAVSGVFKKHTGMTVRLNVTKERGHQAYVYTAQADIANPMRPNEVIKRVSSLGRPASEKELFKGTVDLKNGTVSGIYSEIPLDIFISDAFFKDKATGITAENIAAVMTHEVGHGFTYLLYLGRMVISSVVVSEICRKQHENAPDKVIRDVVKVAAAKTGYRLRDLMEINASTDPLVIQQVVMADTIENIRSELGTRFYDRRAFEFSADQFVARHGGAHLIVDALDKLNRHYPGYMKEYRGSAANMSMAISGYLDLLFGSSKVAVGGLATVIGTGLFKWAALTTVINPAILTVAGVAALWIGMSDVISILFSDVDNGIYDPIEHRFAAMRRELISSSKNQNLTAVQRNEIIEHIEQIDRIIANLGGKSYIGPDILGEWLVGVFTGRVREQKFQRMLEELVNNRLYEMSNKLQAKTV